MKKPLRGRKKCHFCLLLQELLVTVRKKCHFLPAITRFACNRVRVEVLPVPRVPALVREGDLLYPFLKIASKKGKKEKKKKKRKDVLSFFRRAQCFKGIRKDL